MTAAVALLTADAKTKLSSTIRGLRDRLLTDLHNAADSAYKLSIRDRANAGLSEAAERKRQRLEDWLDEQLRAELGKAAAKGKQAKPPTAAAEREIWDRHLREAIKRAAATLLNRLVVVKLLEAMGESKPMVVTGGWESPGYREFRDWAPDLCQDATEGYGFLLKLLFDELALELPGLFGRGGQMTGLTELFPVPEATLRHVVEQLNQPELASAWGDDTTLGWVYQYWNDPEREALDAKLNGGGKVEPHEVASKTQMFTERYMVEWLLQNSLGQQWLAICAGNGWVPLVESEGVLARLAARRSEWRARREAGEVALDALMPIETELEGRWKYWVRQPGLAPSSPQPPSPTRGEGGAEPFLASNLPSPLVGEGPGVRGSQEPTPDFWEVPESLKTKMKDVARQFRKEPTPSEKILWEALRGKKLDGRKFRRQQPIGSFVVDFFCADERLIVEVDGLIHESQREADQQRQELLESLGLQFVRVKAEDVENSLEQSLALIRAAWASPSSPQPPSPTRGEGGAEAGGLASDLPSPLVGEGPGVRGSQSLTSIRDIKILDPACGSGHFLVIAFDLLVALYEEEARHRGVDWSLAQVGEWILANNLHGLDLDPRAVQIAAAGLFLKARGVGAQVSRLNLVASNLSLATLPGDDPARVALQVEVEAATGIPAKLTGQIVEALAGADAWGSLLRVDDAVDRAIRGFEAGVQLELGAVAPLSRSGRGAGGEGGFDSPSSPQPPSPTGGEGGAEPGGLASDLPSPPVGEGPGVRGSGGLRAELVERLERFLVLKTRSDDLGLRLRGEQLAAGVRFIRLVREGSYDLVVANPPYQGSSKMGDAKYLIKDYQAGKSDLFAAFLIRGMQLLKPGGLSAMITMRNWMFIQQFSDLREWLIEKNDIRVLGDVSWGAFSAMKDNPVTMSVIRKGEPSGYAVAIAPTDLQERVRSAEEIRKKIAGLLCGSKRFEFRSDRFEAIKEKPLIYWWDEEFLSRYQEISKLEQESPARFGLTSGDNIRFVKLWWETPNGLHLAFLKGKFKDKRIFRFTNVPVVMGARGTAWIEALREVLRWKLHGAEVKLKSETQYGSISKQIRNEDKYFSQGISFTTIGADFRARAHRFPSVFSNSASSVFANDTPSVTCLMNSELSRQTLSSLNPSISFQVGDVNRLPLFPIESADEIFTQLDRAFTQHEAARETSVEFKQPGPTCWPYAQAWAQQAVDRPTGAPLPPWQPEYEDPDPAAHVSYALGIALGRFGPNGEGILSPSSPQPPSPTRGEGGAGNQATEAVSPLSRPGRGAGGEGGCLPHGILYLSAYSGDRPEGPDSLNHPACAPLRTAWEQHRRDIERKKDLHTWLREKFFSDCHLKQYEQRPIYLPLSSEKKNFVAHLSIHRWTNTSLQTLIADHLRPDLTLLEGELADLSPGHSQGTGSDQGQDQAKAEKRRNDLLALRQELETFIRLVQQCAEQGPPPASPKDSPRETDNRFNLDLDDGVMVNSAALWPLLEPQGWKKPKAWWSELCTANGKKDYDWSHLAARYFPSRVDRKCRTDPSLAVAHGCFWRYHPAKAYEWELRLQDEIGPHFTLDEPDSDACRQDFETNHPDQVAELKEKETKRRERKHKKEAQDPHSTSNEAQLNLEV